MGSQQTVDAVREGSHRRSKRDSDGWISSLGLHRAIGRDHVLVVAESPLQEVAAAVVRDNGMTPLLARTPLDAIQHLERYHDGIAYAILSSLAWGGLELRALLTDEYPDVARVLLVG